MRRTVIVVLLGLVLGMGTAAPSNAQAGCDFKFGFRTLRDLLVSRYGRDVVGACYENERFEPSTGNSLQRTVGGLLVWRKADNWTAFTDGGTTWINGPAGLASRPNAGPLFTWEAAPAPRPAAPQAVAPATSVRVDRWCFTAIDDAKGCPASEIGAIAAGSGKIYHFLTYSGVPTGARYIYSTKVFHDGDLMTEGNPVEMSAPGGVMRGMGEYTLPRGRLLYVAYVNGQEIARRELAVV
jgi:hypothetical protein